MGSMPRVGVYTGAESGYDWYRHCSNKLTFFVSLSPRQLTDGKLKLGA